MDVEREARRLAFDGDERELEGEASLGQRAACLEDQPSLVRGHDVDDGGER